MNTLISHGVKALAIASLLATSACGTTGGIGPKAQLKAVAAAPTPPPAEDPAALTYRFLVSENVMAIVDPGLTENGTLRERRDLTYNEARIFTQYKKYCAAEVTRQVYGEGWTIAKRTLRSGSVQTLASFASVPLAFESPTASLYRQVPGIGAPLSFMASWDAEDKAVFEKLANAHIQCTVEMIKRHSDEMGDVIGVGVAGLKIKALVTMAPGVEAPVPD